MRSETDELIAAIKNPVKKLKVSEGIEEVESEKIYLENQDKKERDELH